MASVFCVCVFLVAQLCPTLCDPMDCSPPGSSVHGDSPGKNTGVVCHALLQGSSQCRDQTQVSHIAGRFFTVGATTDLCLVPGCFPATMAELSGRTENLWYTKPNMVLGP